MIRITAEAAPRQDTPTIGVLVGYDAKHLRILTDSSPRVLPFGIEQCTIEVCDGSDADLRTPALIAGRHGPFFVERMWIKSKAGAKPVAEGAGNEPAAQVTWQQPSPKAVIRHRLALRPMPAPARVNSPCEDVTESSAIETWLTVFNPTAYDWSGATVTIHTGEQTYELKEVRLGSLQYGVFPAGKGNDPNASGQFPVCAKDCLAVDFSHKRLSVVPAVLLLNRLPNGRGIPAGPLTLVRDQTVLGEGEIPSIVHDSAPSVPDGGTDGAACGPPGPAEAVVTYGEPVDVEAKDVSKELPRNPAYAIKHIRKNVLTATPARIKLYELTNHTTVERQVIVRPPSDGTWKPVDWTVKSSGRNPGRQTHVDAPPNRQKAGAAGTEAGPPCCCSPFGAVKLSPGETVAVTIIEIKEKAEDYDFRSISPDLLRMIRNPSPELREIVRRMEDLAASQKALDDLEAELQSRQKSLKEYLAGAPPHDDSVLMLLTQEIEGLYHNVGAAREAVGSGRHRLDTLLYLGPEPIPPGIPQAAQPPGSDQ